MPILDGWRKFSEWLYEKWDIKNIQKRYDEIDKWTDADFQRMTDGLWSMLPPNLQDQITSFVLALAKRYGEEMAKKVFKYLHSTIKKEETAL
jgi:protoheme ferro-lyase